MFSGLLISALFFVQACNEIDEPLKEQTDSCGDENGAVPIKKILLEDYTGHLCGNCPEAAAEITRLKTIYCDHIIPIGIHVGFFARVDDEYPEDFRTEAGDAYDAFYGATNLGLPKGVINRTEYDGTYALNYQSVWQSAIEQHLSMAPQAELIIENTYNSDTRTLTVEVNTEFFDDFSEEISLSLLLTEDSIIAPQKDYSADPQHIHDYVHRHVLRAPINGIWGESIGGSAARGDILTHSYTFDVDTAYAAEHCEVVAFIFKTESREVIQAESEHLISE